MKLSRFLPLVGAAVVTLGISAFSQQAQALDFTGKNITFTYLFPDTSTVYQTNTVTVQPGTSADSINAFDVFTLDPEANFFDITYIVSSNWTWNAAPFNGFLLSGLDSIDIETITSASLSGTGTISSQLVNAIVSTTPNSVSVNWQGLSASNGDTVRISLTGASTNVPFDIPGGATIPAIGSLVALGAMRKARKSLALKAAAN